MKQILITILTVLTISSGFCQTMDLKSLRKEERGKVRSSTPAVAADLNAYTQDPKKKGDGLSDADKDAFLQKNIPSIIGKSGMAPAFFDDFGISLGDDKLSVTTGTFVSDNKKHSFGGSLSAEAPNGSRTIFQPGGKTPFDFGLELKYTFELKAVKWDLQKGGSTLNKISSVRNTWINISFSNNISKYILFVDDTLNKTQNPYTFEAFISFNYLFNSFVLQNYINKRILLTGGIGYGRFTNYAELDEVNLRKGNVYNNNQLSETEVISGRKIADYKTFNGAIIRVAAYKPLTDPFAFSNVHLGTTLSSFGLGSGNHLLNGTAGVYFSRWKSEDDENPGGTNKKILKELFSVGVIGDFKNLQNAGESNYMKDNFKIAISAQIPLSFF